LSGLSRPIFRASFQEIEDISHKKEKQCATA
jgi:hypothetical protein